MSAPVSVPEPQRRIDQFRQVYHQQIERARTLQGDVRQAVERFLVLVGQDAELSQVFHSEDLSDDQRDAFRGKIEQLEKDTGLTWGANPEQTPQGEANLAARILRSGMMI